MVYKFIKFINKEVSALHEAAYLLAIFALASQLLALVRDRLFASHFGAGYDLDIYYASFRIPDFIFVTVASLVSISVLIPFLMEKTSRSKEEVKKFINSLFSFFFFLIILVCVITFFAIPYFLPIFLPGFKDPQSQQDIILLSRILLLSPILLGVSNFLGSITQMTQRFFVYALSPILYNVGIIVGIFFFSPVYGVTGVIAGVILGAALHVGIQIPFVISQGLFPRLILRINFKEIQRVVLISLPRALTVSLPELARVALVAIASLMAIGSISVFTFASNLQSVPISIIAVSYSLAAFPLLTKDFILGNKSKFVGHMITGCKHIIFLSVPVMVLFVVLRAQVVRTVLGSGQFTWADTRLTAACLAIFTISLIPQSLILLFLRAYYAKGDTKTPLVINLISAVSTILAAFVFTYVFNNFTFFKYFIESLFKVEDLAGSVVLMLPLAYSFGALITLITFWIIFSREFANFSAPVVKTAFQSFTASVLMGFVAYHFLNVFDNILDINTFWGIFLQGLFSGLIGIVAFVLILKLCKSAELEEIWAVLHKKFWKAKVLGPDPEVTAD
jgi:putative peptidoglycan lipid II flippase